MKPLCLSAQVDATPQNFKLTHYQIPLLNSDDGADWDFSKEFSRRFAGQTNTAVGRGVIRHDAFVHSEVETAQPHEIRHLNLVNGRPMVAILIGNDVIATLG